MAGVVSFYPLHSNSNDFVGSNNLYDVNTPTYTALGIRGKCVTYSSATSQQSQQKQISGFTSGDVSLTVSMWINCNSSTDVVRVAGGFVCNNSAFNSSIGLVTYIASTSKADMATYGGDIVSTTYLLSTLNDGRWHYLSYTRIAGAGKISLSCHMFIDGKEVNPYTTSGTDGTFSFVPYWICLGNWCNISGAYQYGYTGKIADAKFYNKAMIASEIKNEYALYKGFF